MTGSLVLGLVSSVLPISMSSQRQSIRLLFLVSAIGTYGGCHRVHGHKFVGIESIDEFPRLKAWSDRIAARPAAQAGLAVPKTQ